MALGGEEVARIAQQGVERRYPAHALVMSEGDPTDTLYVILEGHARAFVSDGEGREAVLSVMGPGEYFGEVALDQGPRSASVVTLEPCRMLVVSRTRVAEFVERNPAFAMHLIRRLIGRVRTLTENVRSLALVDAYGRVARVLLEDAVSVKAERFVPGRPTQAEIASRAGCSREMVSRILKDLVRRGCISLERDRIVVHRAPPARRGRKRG